jgi:hypothetical protein
MVVPTTQPAADALTGAASHVTAFIDLPDLSAWHTPLDKAEILLRKAAQIEHALLVQYLYARYSLKELADVTDPAQNASVKEWRTVLPRIAKEEMGHLMTVQNLRLVLKQDTTFERDDFRIPGKIFPFDLHLEPLTQSTLAKYVVAEAPVDAPNISDIVKLAMGAAGMEVNHVGVLYALLGVVFAANVDEIEQDAAGNDSWYEMVRQIAYLAYYQEPPSNRWHVPTAAFHPETVPTQATAAEWKVTGNMHVFTIASRQDAKSAVKDIGLQGEGLKMGVGGVDSHFERFLSIYRGKPGILPYPAKGGWVPTYDVPTDPYVSNDTTDPRAISNPVAQDWANLADLRYALLLGFLEQYFLTAPAARDFLPTYAIDEMLNLKQLTSKLVKLDRTATGGGKAALPFKLPKLLQLPKEPMQQWPVHVARMTQAIALENKMLQTHSAGDPVLLGMQSNDPGKLTKLQQMGSGGGTAPPPVGGPGTGQQSRLNQVRKILNDATGTGNPSHGGAKRFWDRPLQQFIQTKVYGLNVIETTGDNRGARSNLIKALKGEAPFDDTDFPRMPKNRPPVSPENITFIQKWIDDGCPDDPM